MKKAKNRTKKKVEIEENRKGKHLIEKIMFNRYINGFGLLFITLLLLISSLVVVSSASYSRTSPAYTQTTFPSLAGRVDFPLGFDRQMCQSRQDFLLQITPFGCSPSVVRSDLLEEQNVPVFCQLYATKMNPLIDFNAINFISFYL